jgi:hypothetical protein
MAPPLCVRDSASDAFILMTLTLPDPCGDDA